MATTFLHKILKSPNESYLFGKKLAGILKPSDIVSFTGDLGVGKTHIIRSMVYALGISEQIYITSPTYTLINEYQTSDFTFYHIDLYRISSEDELWEIGFFDILNSSNVIVAVEWWNLLEETIPDHILRIHIKEMDFNVRSIEISGNENWEKRLLPLK